MITIGCKSILNIDTNRGQESVQLAILEGRNNSTPILPQKKKKQSPHNYSYP